MVSCNSIVFLLSIVLVFLEVSCQSPESLDMKVVELEIQEICSRAPTPSDCIEILISEPQIATADLKTLSSIIIDKTEKNATECIAKISMFKREANDPRLRTRYEACNDFYNVAESAIGRARPGDYLGMSILGSAALENLKQCTALFARPPQEPTQLPQLTENLTNLCGVVFAIGKKGSS